jgi:hypothetical protein
VEAWGLEENLADKEGVVGGLDHGQGDERVVPRGLETVDPRSWKEVPSLWTSLEGGTYAWPFAYVDEAEQDVYTRKRHGGYLEITRIWGDGRYEFKGYALDSGAVDGVVRVDEPKKFVNRDRFKGSFFLWPDGEDPVVKRRLWRLVPADEARMTPDDLAAALLSGKAELATWGLERVGGKLMWKRTVRDVQEAVIMPARPKPPPQKPAPNWNDQGPDLVVLNDGRWFRGRVTKRDEQEVTILTRVGQGEMPMTFKTPEVKEVQTPEKR